MTAYYNEINKFAAAWLRELIKAGHIADGEVDTRSIEDVQPDDLRGFDQYHFFAGIGGWSLALRRAGWPDDRPIWTGSCPCQPFSAAGKGAAFADERHLWPHFHWLIEECCPTTIFGEQVAGKDAEPWIDLVHADLEALDYAFGCVPFPSASVGAPHIRDRSYWMANAESDRFKRGGKLGKPSRRDGAAHGSTVRWLVNDSGARLEGFRGRYQASIGWITTAGPTSAAGEPRGMADYLMLERQEGTTSSDATRGWDEESAKIAGLCGDMRSSPTNGFWRDADWLFCRDGKWRPVEPGTFPLAHGVPARVGRLRGYGNAINAQQAALFIEVAMECMP